MVSETSPGNLILAMQNPDLYDHPVDGFQVIETHISQVILTGDYAYKIKKPMDFGFLNFSTLDRRKHFCEEELRLNLTAPAENTDQDLYVSQDLPQTARVMVKDEDLCVHCGLCAERCPTAAWDMQRFDLLIPYAGKPTWIKTPETALTTSS